MTFTDRGGGGEMARAKPDPGQSHGISSESSTSQESVFRRGGWSDIAAEGPASRHSSEAA